MYNAGGSLGLPVGRGGVSWKCIENCKLKMYFSKYISQNVFVKMYFSKFICQNVLVRHLLGRRRALLLLDGRRYFLPTQRPTAMFNPSHKKVFPSIGSSWRYLQVPKSATFFCELLHILQYSAFATPQESIPLKVVGDIFRYLKVVLFGNPRTTAMFKPSQRKYSLEISWRYF